MQPFNKPALLITIAAFVLAGAAGCNPRAPEAVAAQAVTPQPAPTLAPTPQQTKTPAWPSFFSSKPPNGMPERMIGRPAPEFIGVKGWANGTSTTLAALRGKVVMLEFFFNACGACMADMPRVIALEKRYAPEGLVLIGVHADLERDVAQMKAHMNRGIRFPVVLDGGGAAEISGTRMTTPGATCAAYGVYVFPTKFLIDKHGIIRAVIQHSESGYERQIEELLKEPFKEVTSKE